MQPVVCDGCGKGGPGSVLVGHWTVSGEEVLAKGHWHDSCWKARSGDCHTAGSPHISHCGCPSGECHFCGSELSGNDPGAPQSAPVDSGATGSAEGSQISGTEERVTSATGGQKGQKLARFDLIPGDSLWKVAELYGAGAQKYEARNWERGYDWSLSFAALQRHAWQFWNGEDCDAETGQPHMASVAFHALALLRFMDAHPEFDDRA